MRSFLASFLLGISMICVVAPLCADDTNVEEQEISEEETTEASDS